MRQHSKPQRLEARTHRTQQAHVLKRPAGEDDQAWIAGLGAGIDGRGGHPFMKCGSDLVPRAAPVVVVVRGRDQLRSGDHRAVDCAPIWLGGDVAAEPYRCAVDGAVIAGPQLVAAAYDDYHRGRPRDEIGAAFHEGVAAAAVNACAQAGDPRLVVLSGGTFQNMRLLRSVRAGLETLGFRVLTHRLVPANDGGISYGQAAIAARRTRCA